MQHVVPIRIRQTWLAIDALCVEQILGQSKWMRVPMTPRPWPGVMAWRGRAVAILDLGLFCEGGDVPWDGTATRHVIARACGCHVAIPVDEVRESRAVEEQTVRPSLVTRQRYSQREIELEGQILAVFDLEELVRDTLATAAEQRA
jgi:chemotaxis signal transduction protein